MKRFILFIQFCISSSAVLKGQDSIQEQETNQYKNSIGIEIMGNSYLYSIFYERNVLKNNLAIRLGFNWHNVTFNNAGGSIIHFGPLYKFRISQRFNIKIGLFSNFFITYQPNPATKAEREAVLKNPSSFGTPYEPPLQFSLSGASQFHLQLKKYSIYVSYSPLLLVNYGKEQIDEFVNWGGIGVSKSF